MGKKKFDKKNAQHFWVLHRSQTDETRHIVEGQVSEHVLVPVENLNEARRRRAQQQKAEELLNLPVDELFRRGDHINQYGLPNDGYDYSSHFKEMGGGKFMSASGQMTDPGIQARRIELPEEVLPGNDMGRMLEHITISENCMDPDLRDALFASDDEDGEGGFEELLDDFVLQASQAPTEPPTDGFDFDAHIAKLIAASQMELESRLPPRGWEDGIDKSRIIRRPKGGQLDDEDEFFEDDEFGDDEEFDGEVAPTADPLLEEKFEETMKEYEDEEIGDLEDFADDDSMNGRVDIYDDAAFNEALDDFLAMQREQNDESIQRKPSKASGAKGGRAEADGATKGQGARGKKKDYSILLAEPAAGGDGAANGANEGADDAESEAEPEEPALEELTPAQRAALEAQEAEEAEEILASHEYLGAERPKLEWDCETILSTYSVLDNHPTMIKLPPKKKSGRTNGAAKPANGDANAGPATQPAKGSVSVAPQRIILSNAGLPTEFLPERQTAKAHSGISLSAVTPVSTDKRVVDTSGGRKGETKEERKQRKAKVKQEQKERRERKKATREVFKQEEQQQLRRLANASATQENVPVHRFA